MTTVKKFDDGSELTVGGLCVAIGAGAVMATAFIVVAEKYNGWKTTRIMKKHGWPKKSYEK